MDNRNIFTALWLICNMACCFFGDQTLVLHVAYLECRASVSKKQPCNEDVSLASSQPWDTCTLMLLTMQLIWQNQPAVIRHIWSRNLLTLHCWTGHRILRYPAQLCQWTPSTVDRVVFHQLPVDSPGMWLVSQASTKREDVNNFARSLWSSDAHLKGS